MFRKSLFASALRHTSQQLISTMQQLESRRDDFDLVEGLASDTRGAGLEATAMFRPPATPYVSVRAQSGMERVLQSVAGARGLNLAPNYPAGWLMVNPSHGKNACAIEVVAEE
ncbi:hypothetical protein [Chromobacterium paludis]|uniref:Uncharacterized protein n=1 Tax=Chromobacterium paludis TaxID=2605945 RepID=A0A5C1DFA6_9NEIS|nr:hypothetical protein [Chromobacterium paludis]QEL55474.1 hypothetical protein FYK34_07805 [Chromobacterium paludis]